MLVLKGKRLSPQARGQPGTRNKPVRHRPQKSEEKHCFPLVPCLNRTGATCDERRRDRIETIEKDYGCGFFGHCIGTWGLCTAQGGDATTTKEGLRKIAFGTGQFVVGYFALKARSRFGLAFIYLGPTRMDAQLLSKFICRLGLTIRNFAIRQAPLTLCMKWHGKKLAQC